VLRARVFHVPTENLVGGRRAPGHSELNQRPIDVFSRARDSSQKSLVDMSNNDGVLGAELRIPEDSGGGGGRGDLNSAERNSLRFNVAIATGDKDIRDRGVHVLKNITKLFNMVFGLALLGRLVRADIKL